MIKRFDKTKLTLEKKQVTRIDIKAIEEFTQSSESITNISPLIKHMFNSSQPLKVNKKNLNRARVMPPKISK